MIKVMHPSQAWATFLSTYKFNNSNQITNKYNKIFHAIENDYHRVIKSFLECEIVDIYM